jgi:predicted AAA+ superfamily ATPase
MDIEPQGGPESGGTIPTRHGKANAVAMDTPPRGDYLGRMSDTLPFDTDSLRRIADALDRLAPPPPPDADLTAADAFVWLAASGRLQPVPRVNRVDIGLLKGIDLSRDTLLQNTARFARGFPANNALLWGARGMGKSSLVKSAHAAVNADQQRDGGSPLKLVEIHREDIETLSDLMNMLRKAPFQFLLFCDDLSFDADDSSYKALKAILDGGIEGRPANVLLYATSNRRHLMPRDMIENEQSTAINPGEAVEEKVSLSDRFGLWLGFHNAGQEQYFAMITGYAEAFGLDVPQDRLRSEGLQWSMARGGSRSGRTAWQFIQDLAGRLGVKLP